eukprot:g8783.t1
MQNSLAIREAAKERQVTWVSISCLEATEEEMDRFPNATFRFGNANYTWPAKGYMFLKSTNTWPMEPKLQGMEAKRTRHGRVQRAASKPPDEVTLSLAVDHKPPKPSCHRREWPGRTRPFGTQLLSMLPCRELQENFGILFERQSHVDLQVCAVLRELRHVQGLRLLRCGLTDCDAIWMGFMLEDELMALQDNWLSQLGHSGNSSKWSAIRLLDLRYNTLTSASCPALATVISGGLQALLLDGNRLQVEGFEVARLLPWLPRRCFGELSIFERMRSSGKRVGPVKHRSLSDMEKEDLYPGRGNKRCERGEPAGCRGHLAGPHLQPWYLTSHLRGVNTDALPMAKFEREQADAASKAPEHKVSAMELPKKPRRVKSVKRAVVIPAPGRQRPQVVLQKEPPTGRSRWLSVADNALGHPSGSLLAELFLAGPNRGQELSLAFNAISSGEIACLLRALAKSHGGEGLYLDLAQTGAAPQVLPLAMKALALCQGLVINLTGCQALTAEQQNCQGGLEEHRLLL